MKKNRALLIIMFVAWSLAHALSVDSSDYVLVSYKLSAGEEALFSSTDGKVTSFWNAWDTRPLDYASLVPSTNGWNRTIEGFSGLADANMNVRAAYGEKGLYLFYKVVDNQFCDICIQCIGTLCLSDPSWMNDAVDFWIDQISTAIQNAMRETFFINYSYNRVTKTCANYQARLGNSEPVTSFRFNRYDPATGLMAYNSYALDYSRQAMNGLAFENIKLADNTKVQEWFMPWQQIGKEGGIVPQTEGKKIAFVIGYNDADGGADQFDALRWKNRADPTRRAVADSSTACTPSPSGGYTFPCNWGHVPVDAWGDIEFGPSLGSIVPTHPEFVSTPPQIAYCGAPFSYQILVTSGISSGAIDLTLRNGPSGMYLEQNVLMWSPTCSDTGIFHIVLVARNQNADTVQQEFSLQVAEFANQKPAITTIALKNAYIGSPYQDTVRASDPDSDQVYWSLINAPNELSIGSTSGILSWPASSVQTAGTHHVTICASDGHFHDTVTFLLRIKCSAITIPELPPDLYADSLLSLHFAAVDCNGDSLTWILLQRPQGMVIDNNTLFWRPASNQLGTAPIVVLASNGSTGDTVNHTFLVHGFLRGSSESLVRHPLEPHIFAIAGGFQIVLPEKNFASTTAYVYDSRGCILVREQLTQPGVHTIKLSPSKGFSIAKLKAQGKVLFEKLIIRMW